MDRRFRSRLYHRQCFPVSTHQLCTKESFLYTTVLHVVPHEPHPEPVALPLEVRPRSHENRHQQLVLQPVPDWEKVHLGNLDSVGTLSVHYEEVCAKYAHLATNAWVLKHYRERRVGLSP